MLTVCRAGFTASAVPDGRLEHRAGDDPCLTPSVQALRPEALEDGVDPVEAQLAQTQRAVEA
jgi:hypothetical protein